MTIIENSHANNGIRQNPAKPPKAKRAPLARVERKALGEVTFKGLFAVRVLLGADGKRRVVVNEIAATMGLDAKGLRDRVHRSFVKGRCVMPLPSAGGEPDVLTLDIHYLPALLVTIEADRCREAIRERLTEIQEELYDALAAYTFEGQATQRGFTVTMPALPLVDPTVALLTLVNHAIRTGKLGCAVAHINAARGQGIGAMIQMDMAYGGAK